MRALLATTVALVALVAAGCGGDDEGGANRAESTPSAERSADALTVAEYRRRGNALCRKALVKVRGVDPPSAPDEIADSIEATFEAANSFDDEFAALEPPDELRDEHEESVRLTRKSKDVFADFVEAIRRSPNPQAALTRESEKFARSPLLKRSVALTRRLGLTDCLNVGAPADVAPA